MPKTLPPFRYHPDPLATGNVAPSDKACVCCGQARGLIYKGPTYSTHSLRDSLCPWCIADGGAAERFGASFVDDYPLLEAGLPLEIVNELCERTPGYISWQQDSWLSHCGDACAFHGDASLEDVANASPSTREQWLADYQQDEAGWRRVSEHYRPAGDSALYKFVCRHCSQVLFGWDTC